jgi:hypothetical protein
MSGVIAEICLALGVIYTAEGLLCTAGNSVQFCKHPATTESRELGGRGRNISSESSDQWFGQEFSRIQNTQASAEAMEYGSGPLVFLPAGSILPPSSSQRPHLLSEAPSLSVYEFMRKVHPWLAVDWSPDPPCHHTPAYSMTATLCKGWSIRIRFLQTLNT